MVLVCAEAGEGPGLELVQLQGQDVRADDRALDFRRPASGMPHAVFRALRMLRDEVPAFVELRKAGGDGPPLSDLDPVKVDPKHYTVDFENDQVRVIRVRIGPHESTPMHEHVRKRVAVFFTSQDFRAIDTEGKSAMATNEAGAVIWGEGPQRHKEANLSDQPFEALMVELK